VNKKKQRPRGTRGMRGNTRGQRNEVAHHYPQPNIDNSAVEEQYYPHGGASYHTNEGNGYGDGKRGYGGGYEGGYESGYR